MPKKQETQTTKMKPSKDEVSLSCILSDKVLLFVRKNVKISKQTCAALLTGFRQRL